MKKVLFLMLSVLILSLIFATGCTDIAKISNQATVNTNGDLYKCECFGDDTATGLGTRIKPKGTWFMYNQYGYGNVGPYDIQAGNPKNDLNIIGQYSILSLGSGWYRAEYWISPVFVVVDEHLAISDSPNFTAAPGKDDNQDFGVSFYDVDGEFYIFAHFAVECAE